MFNLKRIVKGVLQKAGILSNKDAEETDNISMVSDEKLISMIGMEMHSFYYPAESQVRSSDYLEHLISHAERRGLSCSENIKGAKTFLEELKVPREKTINEDVGIDVTSAGNFFELAKRRHSTRKFSGTEISRETIRQILECAIEAPSSCNRQSWRFLVCEDKKALAFISGIRRIGFLNNAPTVICVLVDEELYIDDKELGYTIYMDGAAAIMNIIYAAESLGISSCWVNFGRLEISEADMNKFSRFFRVEPNFKPVSLVALGYGTQNIEKPRRESIDYYLLDGRPL